MRIANSQTISVPAMTGFSASASARNVINATPVTP